MAKIENVEQFIQVHPKWEVQLLILRRLLVSFHLSETIKWGAPVYTKNGKNLVGISAFKNHFGLWFFQGASLQNNTELLVNAQKGKTQAMRQLRLGENSEIDLNTLKKYIKETITLHDQGKKVKLIPSKNIIISEELNEELANDLEYQKAFKAITPSKQKEYSLYIIEAKREVIKLKRLEKIKPMILAGIGINDKYKKC